MGEDVTLAVGLSKPGDDGDNGHHHRYHNNHHHQQQQQRNNNNNNDNAQQQQHQPHQHNNHSNQPVQHRKRITERNPRIPFIGRRIFKPSSPPTTTTTTTTAAAAIAISSLSLSSSSTSSSASSSTSYTTKTTATTSITRINTTTTTAAVPTTTTTTITTTTTTTSNSAANFNEVKKTISNVFTKSTLGTEDSIANLKLTPIATCRSVSLPDIIDSATIKTSPVLRFQPGNKEGEKWQQRKERIESALAWVRSELNFIRAQDKALLSQLQQCQENIEWLKSQRQQAAEQHELQSLTDDDSYWEDWEISEFEREEKLGLQSFNSKRFAYSNPELNQSLLATYTAKNTTLNNDIEIQLQQ